MADDAVPDRTLRRADARKTAVRVGIAAGVALLVVAVVLTATMWLLLFGAVLLAALLRGLSDWLADKTPIGPRVAYALVTVSLFALAVTGAWIVVPDAVQEGKAFAARLPELTEQARRDVASTWWGERIFQGLGSSGDVRPLLEGARAAVLGSTGILIQLVVLVVIGLYLGASPETYVRGLLRLAPPARRPRVEEVLLAVGRALKGFLLGRVVSMIAVGVLTGVGLALIGVRLPVTLGILVGLLTFVPYAGPLAGTIPIALAAAADGWTVLAGSVAYYATVQCVEGFVVTPLVQQKMVRLPPAMTLAAQVFMGVLFGPLGVILAMPFAAAALVVVRMVYVGDVLGDEEAKPPQGT